MKLTPERIELLRKVQEKIRTEPEAYNQEHYGRVSPCGTACCIAGWICILSGKYTARPLNERRLLTFFDAESGRHVEAHGTAQSLLGLTDTEADRLFSATGTGIWPQPFSNEWCEVEKRWGVTGRDDRTSYADIAVRYIDYIIENGRVD